METEFQIEQLKTLAELVANMRPGKAFEGALQRVRNLCYFIAPKVDEKKRQNMREMEWSGL